MSTELVNSEAPYVIIHRRAIWIKLGYEKIATIIKWDKIWKNFFNINDILPFLIHVRELNNPISI